MKVKSMKEYQALLKKQPMRGSKYNAVPTEVAGIRFATKKEAEFYELLLAKKKAGEIKYILRQVPFDLPGHYDNGKVIRHYVDFAVCMPDGTFEFFEVKGRDLPLGKMKRLQVEDLYDIKIHLVR